MTTSRALLPPWSAIGATGMPRPLSVTVHEPSGLRVISTAVALAREGLVDAVVDDLVDEVVESPRPGRADVHARPAADRLQALEDRDVPGVVGGGGRRDAGRWLI